MNREPRISQREVIRKHRALLEDVQANPYYLPNSYGTVNCYTCENGHVLKTVELDVGATPASLKCGSCDLWARSSFYKDTAPDAEPTVEWHRPSLKECLRLRDKPQLLDHVFNGGLLERKIKKINENPLEWHVS